MSDSLPVVLVVEDDRELADAYTTWLNDSYAVRTAYRGTEALDQLDDTVDVVLLDRRIPDVAGDEVLSTIRSEGFSCRVAMVTAVEPDFDIIQMGFDEYLCKPVSSTELIETVDRLVDLVTYDLSVQRQLRIASKLSALRASKTAEELQTSAEYQQLTDELAALTPEASDQIAALFEQRSTEWVMERIVGPPL